MRENERPRRKAIIAEAGFVPEGGGDVGVSSGMERDRVESINIRTTAAPHPNVVPQ